MNGANAPAAEESVAEDTAGAPQPQQPPSNAVGVAADSMLGASGVHNASVGSPHPTQPSPSDQPGEREPSNAEILRDAYDPSWHTTGPLHGDSTLAPADSQALPARDSTPPPAPRPAAAPADALSGSPAGRHEQWHHQPGQGSQADGPPDSQAEREELLELAADSQWGDEDAGAPPIDAGARAPPDVAPPPDGSLRTVPLGDVAPLRAPSSAAPAADVLPGSPGSRQQQRHHRQGSQASARPGSQVDDAELFVMAQDSQWGDDDVEEPPTDAGVPPGGTPPREGSLRPSPLGHDAAADRGDGEASPPWGEAAQQQRQQQPRRQSLAHADGAPVWADDEWGQAALEQDLEDYLGEQEGQGQQLPPGEQANQDAAPLRTPRSIGGAAARPAPPPRRGEAALWRDLCEQDPMPSTGGGAVACGASDGVWGAGGVTDILGELHDVAQQQQQRQGGRHRGSAGDEGQAPPKRARTEASPPAQLAVLASLDGGGLRSRPQAAAGVAAPTRDVCPLPHRMAADVPGQALPVTGADGTRVYCRLAPLPTGQACPSTAAAVHAALTGSLLSEAVDVLLARVEAARVEAVMEESRVAAQEAEATAVAAAAAAADAAEAAEPGAAETSAAGALAAAGVAADPPQRQLWVEKYAPRGFTSLLSEDWINREVARWVRTWHRTVFGAPADAGAAAQLRQLEEDAAAASNGAGRGRGRGGRGGRGGGAPGDGGEAAGVKRRREGLPAGPSPRIILICGPPGLGKTTLAHVVAHHCGYRAVEVNASDDRSAAALARRVRDAAEMQAVLGERRPNLVILDEIDGAAGGSEAHSAVAALLKLVTPPDRASAKAAKADDGANPARRKRRGAGAGGAPISRPVIAICNDLYAPALRPLRTAARVFTLRPPLPGKLVARLALVCRQEGITADPQALSLLVERCQGDIRGCLNTLQLLARQGRAARRAGPPSAHIRASDIARLALGDRDVSGSARGLLADLLLGAGGSARYRSALTRTAEAAGCAGGGGGGRGGAAAAALSERLYGALLHNGDFDMLMAGVHDNWPALRGMDVDMRASAALASALAEADVLMSSSRHGSTWVGHYVPACLLQAASCVGAEQCTAPQLQWPRAQAECARKAVAATATLHAWVAAAPAAAGAALSMSRAALLDVTSAMQRLLQPTGVRPVAPHLLSPQETGLLEHLVQVLVSYGLNYTFPEAHSGTHPSGLPGATAAGEGGEPLRPAPVTPEIDLLHRYHGLQPPGGRGAAAVPLAVRQLVARRVAEAGMRRSEAARYHGEHHDGPQQQQQGTPQGSQQQRQPSSAVSAKAAVARNPGGPAPRAAPEPQPAAKGCWLNSLAAKQRQASKRRPLAPRPAATADVGVTAGAKGGDMTEEEGATGPSCHLVVFKYTEGYTNAVKRPLRLADLLATM